MVKKIDDLIREADTAIASIATHPVQTLCCHRGGVVRIEVMLAVYEVYCEVYGAQEALITGGCRDGFSEGELIAFLYARAFPKEQWRERFHEAFAGMKWGGR